MDPDLVFIVSYECPRCHAALEARANGPPAWLRCPSCGRASLPPELTRRPPPPIDEDTFVIGPVRPIAVPLPIRPRPMTARPSPVVPKGQTARIILGTGFFLTTFLFLFSLLEPDRGRSFLFALAAGVCLFLLARPASPGYRD